MKTFFIVLRNHTGLFFLLMSLMPQSHGRQTPGRQYYNRGTTEGLDCRSSVLTVLGESGGSRGGNLDCRERTKKVGRFLNMFKNSPDRARTASVVALS